MNIVEMREKRAKLWNTMEGFLDTHRTDKGVLSAEDDATYNNMEKELNDLTNEIRRMERRDAIEAELKKPVDTPLTGKPMDSKMDEKKGRASNAYKEDFGRHLRGKQLIHNVMEEGVDANGGYLVPEEFERQIITGLDEFNVMRNLCKVITTSAERKIPVAATHSTAAWTAEKESFPRVSCVIMNSITSGKERTRKHINTTKGINIPFFLSLNNLKEKYTKNANNMVLLNARTIPAKQIMYHM